MRFLGDITPVLLAFLISTTAAAPQAEAAPGCIVPLVIFESLSKPFTLAALIPGPSTSTSQASIPVRITPFTPTKKTSSKPIISRAKIASTQFKLQNGKLIAAGFKAELLPSLAIFPPPLEAFVFGGNSPTSPINFSAGYACDSTGDVFLELLVEQGKHISINIDFVSG